jgi:dCMP deaminase
MKQKYIDLYNDFAERTAKLSHAKRLQVGAVIVKDDTVISYGYNGMPSGWDNNCEDKEFMSGDEGGWLNPEEIETQWPFEEWVPAHSRKMRYRLKTKPEVLHAESNAIAKLAKSINSGNGADIFITHAPCLDCAKLVFQAGIKRVWFGTAYRDDSGIKFLQASGIEVLQIKKGS